ncbi:YeeE/YedE thiosulfate transporter family protein [Thiomicrospira sp. ALE5]|uniref:YeeE/YedE thiosulfate transporter family protein n=1 Tax=Thiomicrospira sp. ALE5 TaxID=748650 RepID=UPI0008E1736B|nr:YeeE/YedE thiosulfate transporter family protein [Thiomicrospira sp. ALE5]SFR61247.1 hypothetical protein SAMN03092900_1730 [Thiomicrospira sp. ALE5]
MLTARLAHWRSHYTLVRQIILATSAGLLILILSWLVLQGAWVSAGLLLVGMGLGATLNYFVFGFSSSWRKSILEGNTLGARAQVIMLAAALLLFSPLLWLGQSDDWSFQGLVRPAGWSVILGAFLFGIGMQLASNCSSGTLNRVGQLQALPMVSLLMMFVGGVLAAYSFTYWDAWPALHPWSFTLDWGLAGLLMSLGLLALIYWALTRYEQRRTQQLTQLLNLESKWGATPYAPSSSNDLALSRAQQLLLAGLLLALLSAFILLLAGQPWSVASVFALWPFKLAEWIELHTGWMLLDWSFWDIAGHYQDRVARPLWLDHVSMTTLGVIFGALAVTLLQPKAINPLPVGQHAIGYYALGGLLMGLGAMLSYGCNIGALFSGIASGSLHGWLWLIAAVIGNMVALAWLNRSK